MDLLIYPDAEMVAQQAAALIVQESRNAIAARGQFTLALSGGSTPWRMLALLVQSDFKWEQVQIFQVDERVAPLGDAERNWTHLTEALRPCWNRIAPQAHPMPVDNVNLQAAAADYATTLTQYADQPPVLDLVHLGLGADGHTASLVPGDPLLSVTDRDVAVTLPYQNHVRMTLTLPVLNRARRRLWVVTGAQKREALNRLLQSDPAIPAGQVRAAAATILADRDAVGA